MFDKITKYLSLFSICIFIWGYAYKQSFYSVFNIDITNYISNSEILYTLLPLVIVVLTFTINVVQFLQRRQQKQIPTTPAEVEQEENSSPPKKKKIRLTQWSVFIILAFLCIALEIFFSKNIFFQKITPFLSLGSVVFMLLSLVNHNIKEVLSGNFNTWSSLIVFVFIGFTCFKFGKSMGYARQKNWDSKIYTFKIKDKVIKTDEFFYIIGETQSTLFFYNRKDSTTVIYKRSEIDSLAVKAPIEN